MVGGSAKESTCDKATYVVVLTAVALTLYRPLRLLLLDHVLEKGDAVIGHVLVNPSTRLVCRKRMISADCEAWCGVFARGQIAMCRFPRNFC